jgi:hypothetical protein
MRTPVHGSTLFVALQDISRPSFGGNRPRRFAVRVPDVELNIHGCSLFLNELPEEVQVERITPLTFAAQLLLTKRAHCYT